MSKKNNKMKIKRNKKKKDETFRSERSKNDPHGD